MFEAFNDAGVLVLDSTSPVYVLKQKLLAQTFSVAAAGYPPRSLVQVTVPSSIAPLVAVAPIGSAQVALANVQTSGATRTFNLIAPTGSQADIYVFDHSVGTPVNAGLEVYNAAGVRGFHSAEQPLRIAGGFSSAGGLGPGFTKVAGRNYATVLTGAGFGFIFVRAGQWRPQCWAVRDAGTTINVAILTMSNTVASDQDQADIQYLVADVTNF